VAHDLLLLAQQRDPARINVSADLGQRPI